MSTKGIFPPPDLQFRTDWSWNDDALGIRIPTWFSVQLLHIKFVLYMVDYGEWGNKELAATTRIRWIEASDRYKRLTEEEQKVYDKNSKNLLQDFAEQIKDARVS